MTNRLYKEMNAEEQVAWVTEFSELSLRLQGVIEAAAKRRSLPTADAAGTAVAGIRRLFALLEAWGFAQEFCEKARRYGDYMARVSRLPIYLEKVNDALAEGLTTTDERGRRVAVVLPGVPARRRGRPTKEEMAARLRGEIVMPDDDSAEARKRRAIARLLGLEVVAGEAVREKNNAELAAERAAREAEKARREPGLFASAEPKPAGKEAPAEPAHTEKEAATQTQHTEQANTGAGAGSLSCAQLQSDAYELRMAQDKLHLNQLAPLCSEGLQKRMATVQGLRVTSERASERAKMLAEQGADASAIEPYAQQAKEATEAYLAIYADVDEELAVLHKRLYLDEPFKERFIKKHSTGTQKVNIETILHVTRPYYDKVRKDDPGIEARVKMTIETDNPEYAARMKAEEEKKREVSELLRYLKRKDKPNVAQRIKTMEKRYARLVELLGEQEACVYRPIVDAAIEDYEKHYKQEAATQPQHTGPENKKGAKKETKKCAKKGTRKSAKQESKDESGGGTAARDQNGNGNGNQNENNNGKEE